MFFMANTTQREWTRLLGTSLDDYGTAVVAAVDGSVFITGWTKASSLDGQISNGSYEAFISKYTSNGSKSWTRLLGSSTYDNSYSVSASADGSVYVAGRTFGAFDGQINSGATDIGTGIRSQKCGDIGKFLCGAEPAYTYSQLAC